MLDRIKELIETNQYQTLREEVMEMHLADIAETLEELPKEDIVRIFRILPKPIAADVFSYFSLEMQQFIITSLTEKEAGKIIDDLSADDATDLMDEMPASVVKKLLAQADPETRRDINHLLQYPDDSAGSIMTVEFVDLKENLTVNEAIQKIRKVGIDKETIDICYVLNLQRELVGIVSLRQLLLSQSDETIENIMHENVVTINTLTDQEEVALIFKKYDFTAMPVVDSENRLVGIITVDDVVDIMEQEATEDIEMMAAITPTDKPYMKTGVFETWKKRTPWLLILMISSTFTGQIIRAYEDSIANAGYFILTAFIPMLMNTGGNSGSQSSVSVIRSLSLNEIQLKDIFRVTLKEFKVAFLCGITLSAANFLKLIFIDKVSVEIAAIVSTTLVITVISAKVVGAILPIGAKRIGFDPTVMASPFITTIVDALSLIIYFAIATSVLGL